VRYHPGVDFDINDDFVLLENDNGKMALIPVTLQDFEMVEGKHAVQYVNATKDFSWVPYFDTELIAKSEKTTVAAVILPVAGVEEARSVAASKQLKQDQSGNLSLFFKKKGTSYSFRFSSSEKGLTLLK
jgi:hypothetical protein